MGKSTFIIRPKLFHCTNIQNLDLVKIDLQFNIYIQWIFSPVIPGKFRLYWIWSSPTVFAWSPHTTVLKEWFLKHFTLINNTYTRTHGSRLLFSFALLRTMKDKKNEDFAKFNKCTLIQETVCSYKNTHKKYIFHTLFPLLAEIDHVMFN